MCLLRRRRSHRYAPIVAAGNDFFVELLREAGLGGEVSGQNELTEHKVEIVLRFGSRAAVSRGCVSKFAEGFSHFFAQNFQDAGLLVRQGFDKVHAEQEMRARVDVGEAGDEFRSIVDGIPVGEDHVDEFVHANGFRSRSLRLRDDHFRHHGNRDIHVHAESSQKGCGWEGSVHRAEGSQSLEGQGGKSRAQGEELQNFTAIQQGLQTEKRAYYARGKMRNEKIELLCRSRVE